MNANPPGGVPGTSAPTSGKVVIVSPGGAGTPPSPTCGIQEAVNSLRAGGGTVRVSAGTYALTDVVHLASGVSLVFDNATLRCPAGKQAINGTNVTDVSLAGSGSFISSAPGQVGMVFTACQRVVFDGAFSFSGWSGAQNVPAVISQGNRDCRFAGWRTGDSSLFLSLGDTNLEVCRMSGSLAPGSVPISKPFVNVMTNADHPNMTGIRVHDLAFDGGGVIDVSFVRVRLDQAAGRSGTNVELRSIHCRNGNPVSIWCDTLDSYGIVGCKISDIQSDGIYTGLSIANSQCEVNDCVAVNCYSQGLVVGGAGQLGDIANVVVTNFQARRCCRGTDLGYRISNGQILADGTHGRIDNLLVRNCIADARGSEHGFHGFSINGVQMGSITLDGGHFIGAGAGQHLFVAPSVRPGAVRQMTPPTLGS